MCRFAYIGVKGTTMGSWKPRPGGRRSYHHGNLRQAITDNAIARARRDGGEAIVLREIAGEIGVSATASYRHFSGRDELVAVVAEHGLAAIAERAGLDPVVDGGAPAAGDRAVLAAYADFHNLGIALTEFAAEEPAWTRLVVTQMHRDDAVREAFAAVRAVVDGVLERGVQAGTFTEPTPVQRQAVRVGLTGLVSAIVLELVTATGGDQVESGVRAAVLAATVAPVLTERGRALVEAADGLPDARITDLSQWLER